MKELRTYKMNRIYNLFLLYSILKNALLNMLPQLARDKSKQLSTMKHFLIDKVNNIRCIPSTLICIDVMLVLHLPKEESVLQINYSN